MASGRTTVPNELQEGLRHYKPADLSKNTDAIMAKYGGLISQSCGGIPSRLVAARIYIETRGNPTAVARAQTWYCGTHGSEIGLLQINPCNRKIYGITDAQAKDPATNIRIGCQIWKKWTDSFFSELGGVQAPGAWSWLVTSVGPGAVRRLRELAGGYGISDLLSVAGNEALLQANTKYWGSQRPPKIAWRVGTAVSVAKSSGALGAGGIGSVLVWTGMGYLLFKYAVPRFF